MSHDHAGPQLHGRYGAVAQRLAHLQPAAEVLRVLRRRHDVGISVVGVLSDKRDLPTREVPYLGGIEEIRTVLERRPLDLVFIALPHADYPRLTAVLNEIGIEYMDIDYESCGLDRNDFWKQGAFVLDPVHPNEDSKGAITECFLKELKKHAVYR